jgi:ubiquinone/menaquinone biosynthesis C-methylase UbiE
MFDWIERAVRVASSQELVLAVRIHPAEGRWGTREGVQDVLASRLGSVPENIRFISTEHALSSYALLDISDLTLTYTTTVGLEAAARGKRVAVAGETHYRGRGFTTDLAGPEDLARVMTQEPAPPSAEQVELAIRYAHMFFLRVMIPFPPIECENGKVRRFPRAAAELAPGADPYLDWICERILDGGHFGLPDELAVSSPATAHAGARKDAPAQSGRPAAAVGQEELFCKGEADAWFRRNLVKLADEERSVRDAMTAIALEIAAPKARVVDVGASNGWRVAAIARALGGDAVAVDPSGDALEDGEARYPWVTFVNGVARELPLDGECADLVIVCGVLTWLDRSSLMAAVAEIDRVLRDGGHLLLSDFLPDAPTRVRYHHRPDWNAWTYKQDYARAFLGGGLYTELRREVIDPRTGGVASAPVDPRERQSISVLRKDLQGQYGEG